MRTRWDTNDDHTLSAGDLIVFTVEGTSGYSVDTNYFVQANGTSMLGKTVL